MSSPNVIISKEEYDRLLTAERRYNTLRDHPQGPWYFPYKSNITESATGFPKSPCPQSWYMAIAGGEELDGILDEYYTNNLK